MAKLKGICKNIDCCDLAAERVVQEAEKSNFVCSNPECGKPLKQVDDDKGPDRKKKLLIIIIIVAVVLIGGGAGAWFGGLFGESASDTTIVDDGGGSNGGAEIDSIPPTPKFSWGKFDGEYNITDKYYVGIINVTSNAQIDINGKAFNVEPKGCIKNAIIKEGNIIISGDYIKPPKNPEGPKFSWGIYSGPAEGFGGELKVTRQHSIDLGNTRGDVIDVYPGDVIKNTKITNGKIIQGELFRTDGTRKQFTIGV